MPLTITADPLLTSLTFAGPVFLAAVEMSTQILRTQKYCSIVADNISDLIKLSVDEISSKISSMDATVSIIQMGEDMGAYCVVGKAQDRWKHNYIYLNPLLLMQVRVLEIRGASPAVTRKCTLFLVAKIVNAVSHLVWQELRPMVNSQADKRAISGESKRRVQRLERSKDGATFDDLGEMVEYDIFGGIVDMYTSDIPPVAFHVDQLILYKHPASRSGFIVTVKATDYVVTPELDDFVLTVGDEVDAPYRGNRGHLRACMSGARAWVNTDVLSYGDDTCLPEPTF